MIRQAHAEMSERRACVLAELGRSSYRYRRRRPDEAGLRKRLKELAGERRRYGYRRLTVLLWREGQTVNHKRIYRLYREEGWRARRREGRKYKFLYIDGANFAVRINRRVSRQSFCAALGVSEEGECFEVLALEMGDRERADLWENVFGSLLGRGLDGGAVELGIMDGLPGLEGIFKKFFARAQTQRCPKHATELAKNPAAWMPWNYREALLQTGTSQPSA